MIQSIFIGLVIAPSAALAIDGHRPHYEKAKACYIAASVVSLIGSTHAGSMPDNKDYARKVADRYLPVVAFEGHHLGMSYNEITSYLRTSNEVYSSREIKQMNASTKSAQMAQYNEIVAELRLCSEVPNIGQASE